MCRSPTPPQDLAALLDDRAAHGPDTPALLAPGREPLPGAGLVAFVRATASALAARGVGRGERIALVVPNGPEAATAFLAAAAAGVSAPLNPAYRREDFDFYLGDLGARAVLVADWLDSPVRAAAAALRVPVLELARPAGAAAGVFELRGEAGDPAPATPAGADDVALLLHTSGTTSRPKQVPLTHANLLASAGNVAGTLALGPADRCLNVMPLFHIHGLVAALLASLWAGGSVVCTPGLEADAFFRWLAEFRPTWYTAVPTIHQAAVAGLAARGGDVAFGSLRFIRSSSSALPRRVMQELEAGFGVPVLEAYGMTEAAHQMASNPLPPLARKPGSVGLAAGPEVAVMDAAGRLLAPGQQGEVVIRGPNVMGGYVANPDANARAFTDGWFRTGDQGYLDEDGYLFLTGRLKELINRGGEKVSPIEVDEVLMAHPGVAQALTFALPHPTLGEDVAAAVVVRSPGSPTAEQLRDFAAARLPYFKVPRRIVLVDAIPKGATGKPQRIGLAERLGLTADGDGAAPAGERVAPRTPVEEVVAALWAEVRPPGPAGVDDDFFGAGGDSIAATQLLGRVRDLLGVDVPLLAFFYRPTVAALAAEVDAAIGDGAPAADDPAAG